MAWTPEEQVAIDAYFAAQSPAANRAAFRRLEELNVFWDTEAWARETSRRALEQFSDRGAREKWR